jgi:hypothetical protein
MKLELTDKDRRELERIVSGNRDGHLLKRAQSLLAWPWPIFYTLKNEVFPLYAITRTQFCLGTTDSLSPRKPPFQSAAQGRRDRHAGGLQHLKAAAPQLGP